MIVAATTAVFEYFMVGSCIHAAGPDAIRTHLFACQGRPLTGGIQEMGGRNGGTEWLGAVDAAENSNVTSGRRLAIERMVAVIAVGTLAQPLQ